MQKRKAIRDTKPGDILLRVIPNPEPFAVRGEVLGVNLNGACEIRWDDKKIPLPSKTLRSLLEKKGGA